MRRWLWWGLLALGFFLLGLILVWLRLRAAKWGLLPAWPSKSPSMSQVQPTKAIVVSWQPETATLTYTTANENQALTIQPLRPMVIVPIFAGGKLVKDELALTSRSPNWLRVALTQG